MARIVLVHGAFSGAWVWEPLVPELEARGHEVIAIDLPGAGADTTPPEEVTVDAYAQRICETLEAPSVLLANSMGGVAITQAAARCPDKVSALAYVAAFLPEDGESLLDLTHKPEAAGDGVQENLVIEGPVAWLPNEAARRVVYGCSSDEVAAWAAEHRRPQPLRPFADEVRIGNGLAEIPKAYVICLQDQAIRAPLQRLMATRASCDPVIELDTDHSPWLSRREELLAGLEGFLAAH